MMESIDPLMIRLDMFPMCPSVNALYGNNPHAKGKGRYKTKAYTTFENDAWIWSLKHAPQVRMARQICQSLGPGRFLLVHMDFFFEQGKILTKIGTPKKLDTSNRIKATEDALAKILGIDDSWFWNGQQTKNISKHPAFGEYTDIRMGIFSFDPKCGIK